MIRNFKNILAAALMVVTVSGVSASEPEVVTPNYNLAEQFSPTKVLRLVPQTSLHANWFESSNKCLYKWQTVDAINYYIVDPASGKKSQMWAMDDLAEKVTMATKHPFDAQHLPIENIKLEQDNIVLFDIAPHKVMVENNVYAPKDEEGKAKVFHFKWDIAAKSLERIEERDVRYPEWANVSPDGRIAVYQKNSNLWYMTTEDVEKFVRDPKDSTIVEHQITTDATEDTAYHWFEDCIEQIKEDER